MDYIRREQMPQQQLQGRTLCKAFGADGTFSDEAMSMGFARFSLQCGPMRPHMHEREIIYVLDAKGAKTRYGPSPSSLNTQVPLVSGDLIRFGEGEWHVFALEDEDAYLDILWMFPCPQNHTVEK